MRAAVYRSFHGAIRIQDVPYPRLPPDGIILKVLATGVCRSDWHGWCGHDDDIVQHGLPFVPGHEVSGIVVEVGDKSRKFQVNDRVVVPFILSCGDCMSCQERRPTVCVRQQQPGFTQNGSFAEYVSIPRADRNVCKLPSNVTFIQAAALGCRFTTAYRAVLQQGQYDWTLHTLAVFGCGGVGLSCIMIAASQQQRRNHKRTSRIIAVDISEAALHKARELGATDTILCRPTDSHEMVQKAVLDLTNHQGAHITIDAAGFPSTCENAVYCTRRSGRMVQVGLPIGTKAPQVPMGWIAAREIEIVGSHGFAATDLPNLLELIATQKLDPSVLVERCVTLRQGIKALEDMDHTSPLGVTMITDFSDPPGMSTAATQNSKL